MNYQKVRNYCHYTGKYRGATHSICNLKFNVPNEIAVAFHNLSKFEEKFKCLGENTKKYKSGGESVITISYKTKFFDSCKIYGNVIIKSC